MVKYAIEQGESPTPFKGPFSSDLVYRFKSIVCFRHAEFDRDRRVAATPFLRMCFIPFVGEEVFHRSKEKRTKFSPAFVRLPEGVLF